MFYAQQQTEAYVAFLNVAMDVCGYRFAPNVADGQIDTAVDRVSGALLKVQLVASDAAYEHAADAYSNIVALRSATPGTQESDDLLTECQGSLYQLQLQAQNDVRGY